MGAIPIVGTCFATADAFLAYLEGLAFGAWRPKFVTMHHTGAPSLATWRGWQGRAVPVTDAQWLQNLAGYYGALGWRSGPHFFVTPAHICVLSSPTARGVHAVSFNALSWGVEVVGDFDRERLSGDYRAFVVSALAAMHVAADLRPEPYRFRESGLHFHRDDPKTTKTCPGASIRKGEIVAEIEAAIDVFAADDPDERVEPAAATPRRAGTVVAADLNVRADASAKAPVIGRLRAGVRVAVVGEAMNGPTRWLRIAAAGGAEGGYVAARYVDLA